MKTLLHPIPCLAACAGLSTLLLAGAASARAGTITIRTDSAGATPWVAGLNMGHFETATNAPDIWRYLSPAGARMFIDARTIEQTIDSNTDTTAGWGDGVTDLTTFLARRTAMDANALNAAYINWTYIENRYATANPFGGPGNQLKIAPALAELHAQGASILVNITAGESTFPITSASDWAGKWELWQHYYFQAFYLARYYDVRRFSMFNEPNHPNANGLTYANWQMRLELASDAIQRAIAEVNRRYGKALVPSIFAPNTSGNPASGTAWTGWGSPAIANRHLRFDGVTDASWWNFHHYNYQSYGGLGSTNGASFATTLDALQTNIAAAMPGETPFPTAITEVNSLTGADFDTTAETLDTPRRYAQLGSILANLTAQYCREIYVFKLAQTTRGAPTNYPVAKNGLCYTDNDSASPTAWRYGGLTQAAEVARLFYKAAEADRSRPRYDRGGGLDNLDIMITRDNATGRHWMLLVNHDTVTKTVDINTAALGNLQDHRVIIEEVSGTHFGGVSRYTRVNNDVIAAGTMPARSVWLVTIPTAPQLFVLPGSPTLDVAASADAMVKDGANKNVNYGASVNLYAKNDASNANGRNVSFVKFTVPAAVDLAKVELAVLSLTGSTLTASGVAQAFVYACTNDSWSESTVTWANAPGLLQNQPVGNLIRNGVATGQGSTLQLVGQISVEGTTATERQVDVTAFVKTQPDKVVTFVVVQDPRRDFTINPAGPVGSISTGDTQVDGLKFASKEAGATGPVLKIVRRL